MALTVFALLSLCFVFIAHGIPLDDGTLIAPPPAVDETEPAPKGVDPQTLAGEFEGDMIFPDGFDPTDSTRGVAIFGNRQWPNRIIPYDISAISSAADRKTITDAMQTLMYAVGTPIANSNQRNACVYFRPREASDTSYFKIQYGNGCSAIVGHYPNYVSTMTLQQNGCFHSHIIQHELLHVLGFYHEQSRPDRDDFLSINLANVQENMRHNFNKYAWGSTVHNQGSKYDYSSIMHYGTTAFSMNGKATMTPRQAGVVIGNSKALSPMDIAEVRHFYSCKA
jgi:hypothetical protein